MPESGEVTTLLAEVRKGDRRATEIVYQELRRLAAFYMQRERPDHTLQATALVHEAYVRLVGDGARNWRDRAHFFAAAARQMRNLLVDHARRRDREIHGGGHDLRLDDVVTLAVANGPDLLPIDDALTRLGEIDPRQSRIVELRYFGGLSILETAEVLGISERTVRREWQMAKAWLYAEIKGAR